MEYSEKYIDSVTVLLLSHKLKAFQTRKKDNINTRHIHLPFLCRRLPVLAPTARFSTLKQAGIITTLLPRELRSWKPNTCHSSRCSEWGVDGATRSTSCLFSISYWLIAKVRFGGKKVGISTVLLAGGNRLIEFLVRWAQVTKETKWQWIAAGPVVRPCPYTYLGESCGLYQIIKKKKFKTKPLLIFPNKETW